MDEDLASAMTFLVL